MHLESSSQTVAQNKLNRAVYLGAANCIHIVRSELYDNSSSITCQLGNLSEIQNFSPSSFIICLASLTSTWQGYCRSIGGSSVWHKMVCNKYHCYVSRILEVNRCCGRWKEIRGKGTCAQEMQSRVEESHSNIV